MRRRDFITLIGGAAAAWPLAARAQQGAMPVIGFLGAPSAAPYARYIAAVHQGLKEVGYVEHQNVAMEYRWADSQYDRLPALAADLVSRRVAVIVPIGGAPATVAAKAATSTIPIVFNLGADPVGLGLVTNLSRPAANITGIAMMTLGMETKRLELLHELAPASSSLAILLNPSNAQAQTQESEAQRAARVIGRQVLVLKASSEHEIEKSFCNSRARASGCAARRRRYLFQQPADLVRGAHRASCDSHHLPLEILCRCWRSDELRGKPAGWLSTNWCLHRPHIGR
jgi:putative ABC transport system substrate-binding protein